MQVRGTEPTKFIDLATSKFDSMLKKAMKVEGAKKILLYVDEFKAWTAGHLFTSRKSMPPQVYKFYFNLNFYMNAVFPVSHKYDKSQCFDYRYSLSKAYDWPLAMQREPSSHLPPLKKTKNEKQGQGKKIIPASDHVTDHKKAHIKFLKK